LELISYGSLGLGTKPLENSNLKGDIIRIELKLASKIPTIHIKTII
jgi:hypothetical protein